MGCHFLLQWIFPTQGSNPGLPHCRQTLYRLSHQGQVLIEWKIDIPSGPVVKTTLPLQGTLVQSLLRGSYACHVKKKKKMSGSCRGLPHSLLPLLEHNLSPLTTSTTFVTTGEPTLTHQCHPKSSSLLGTTQLHYNSLLILCSL